MERRFERELVGLVLLLTGCRAEADRANGVRLDSLERQIQQAEQRLMAVQKNVAEAEARAEAARAEAVFQSCRAQVKQIRAEVERRRAECAKAVADRNLCFARNSERAANSGLLGCGLGLVAAYFSAGAAAPWALGGCTLGLGAGALSGDECPPATCVTELDTTERSVLTEQGVTSMPRCGGYAGLGLTSSEAVVSRGVKIKRVLPGTYADVAGMAPADVLAEVDGTSIGGAEELADALRSKKEGEPLTVSVLRGAERYELTAGASRRTGNGDFSETIRLGVELGDAVSNVRYSGPAVVQTVVGGGPSASAGVQVGDQVEKLEARASAGSERARVLTVARPEDAEVFFEDLRQSTEVTLHLLRHGQRVEATVRLGPRDRRTEL